MANYFRQMQAALERMGYEYVSSNTKGGETWTHVSHSLVIYPGMKENAHRSLLRDCLKATGQKIETNKRNVENIKDRQAKQREIDRREQEVRRAWLENYIRETETAGAINGLTSEERQLLNARLRELAELRRLMSQTPEG